MDSIFNRNPGWKPLRLGTIAEKVMLDRMTFLEAADANARATAIGMAPVDYVATRVPELAAVELKYNGIGLCWNDAVGATTLEGVPMACARHLHAGFEAMQRAAGDRMFFQAEFVHPDGLEAASSAFQSGREEGFAIVFDVVALSTWRGEIISRPLFERRRILESLHQAARPAGIGLALHSQGYDAEGIELAAGCTWEAGEEGLVVKNLMSPFVRGRSREWMKVKAQLTVDLPIQGTVVVDGRLESISVSYKGKLVVVPVGFTEDQRRLPSFFTVGRMVEIKHNGETKGGFLKGATFLRFRDDKGGGDGS